MKEKSPIAKALTENWGLKLASVLLAAVLWFIVTNINDPVISRAFYNVPVTLRNTEVLTDAGQVFEVVDGTDNIANVTITAQRSIAESFTRENITAVADMNDLTSRNTVPIRLSVNKNANDVVSVEGNIEDVHLNIEDRKTRTISLTVVPTGQLADDYMVGNVTQAQNLVRISGPASKVDDVASAIAEVDVTGFTSEIGTEADIRLFNGDSELIRDTTGIAQNITSVRVQIEILQTRTVGLRARVTGTPAEGYLLTGDLRVAPAQILVAGETAAVENITEITLTGDDLDISGRTETLETTLDVRRFLPAGVTLASEDFNGIVEITAQIAPSVTDRREVGAERIVLENMPEGVVYRATEPVTVTLNGLEADIAALSPEDITLTVDMAQALAGTEENPPRTLQVQAQVTVPQGVNAAGSATVILTRE